MLFKQPINYVIKQDMMEKQLRDSEREWERAIIIITLIIMSSIKLLKSKGRKKGKNYIAGSCL